ncbi:complement regulator-acquiring protein, partial [Borrelia anserina]
FLDSLELETVRKLRKAFIDDLMERARNIKPILDVHNNSSWVEDATQFGMTGNGSKAFDILYNKINNKKASDDVNKSLRRRFYLSLEYDEKTIREFGTVLNQVAAATAYIKNDMLTKITNVSVVYVYNYFEILFSLLIAKKDQLESLSFNDLALLKSKFDQLEMVRKIWRRIVGGLINDYINDKNNIKTDKTKIVSHITSNYGFDLTVELYKINQISKNIVNILRKL